MRYLPAVIALPLVIAGCSSSPPPAAPDHADICVSSNVPQVPNGTRGPDSLCTDDNSFTPVWIWWTIPNGTVTPSLAQPLAPGVGSAAPSGSSQLPNTQSTYGNSSPKAAPAEPEEEPQDKINTQEEEDEQAAQSSEEEESSSSSAAEEEESESSSISSAAVDDE